MFATEHPGLRGSRTLRRRRPWVRRPPSLSRELKADVRIPGPRRRYPRGSSTVAPRGWASGRRRAIECSPYVLGTPMKTREAACCFPVLGFTPDREIWGFPDLDTLTSCGPRTLKNNSQSGMELVDVEGRCWVVRSVRRTGRGAPLLAWLLSHLLSTPQSRIEHELDAMAPSPSTTSRPESAPRWSPSLKTIVSTTNGRPSWRSC